MTQELYFIDELQKISGENRPNIYYYIKEGLFSPVKVGSLNRIMVFDGEGLRTLLRIQNLKRQGIPLREIKVLLKEEVQK